MPFTFTGAMHELTGRLSGVSARATVSTNNAAFTEDILFTHRGLSGPAILQISSYWSPGDEIRVDLLPGRHAVEYLLKAKTEQSKSLLRTVLAALLPRALVAELQDLFWLAVAETPLTEIPDDALRGIAARSVTGR